MLGWAIDGGEQRCRCFIAPSPMPTAKETSKAVGASKVQGRLWCGMAGTVSFDVEIGRLNEEKSWFGRERNTKAATKIALSKKYSEPYIFERASGNAAWDVPSIKRKVRNRDFSILMNLR